MKPIEFIISVGLFASLLACSDKSAFTAGSIRTADSSLNQDKGDDLVAATNKATEPVEQVETVAAVNETESIKDADQKIAEEINEESKEQIEIVEEVEVITPESMPTELTEAPNPDALFKACESKTTESDLPIAADVFELSAGTKVLPDFSLLTPVDNICMNQFDIPQRNFTEGFPGVVTLFEWFGINARALLMVEKEGVYEFTLTSDDGSILYINDTEIINNDGTHSTRAKTGSLFLSAGSHDLQLKYFQGPATEIALQLFWKVPDTSESVIVPTSAFKNK